MAMAILDASYEIDTKSSAKIQAALSEDFWRALSLFNQVYDIVELPKEKHPLKLFSQLGIDQKLMDFIQRKNIYKRALGLMYLYELRLATNIQPFKENLSNADKLVRREAMIGVVVYEGWKILDYFYDIHYLISHWQQIRIIEKLKSYPKEPNINYLNKGLTSKNPTVIELILRVIFVFQVESMYPVFLNELLNEDEGVRSLAQDLGSQITFPESVLQELDENALKSYDSLKKPIL